MAKCSKCGEEEMTFKCRYCGNKYCSNHRLPENHDCDNMEDVKTRSGDSKKWFQDKEIKQDRIRKPQRSRKQTFKNSFFRDIGRTLKNSATLSIILITSISFILQAIPGYREFLTLSPALTQAAVEATNQIGTNLDFGAILTTTLFQKPWSIATVMLTHGGIFHLFANMVTFYFFGSTLEKKISKRKLVKFYIITGIVSSLAYVGFRNLLFQLHGAAINGQPLLINALGASGAVVAVFATVAMLYPDAEVLLYFFIPMKIKTALYLFAGFETINIVAIASGITLPIIGGLASSAHLAGLVCGIWYGKKLRKRFKSNAGVLDLFGY